MSYIDTHGHSSYAIAICDRCSRKFPLDELVSDPNVPGLRVCRDDVDDFDPYRLPPREVEEITLTYPRPDTPLTTISVAPGDPSWPITPDSP